MYREGSKHEAWQDKFGAQISIGLAMCALKGPKKDIPKVKNHLTHVSDASKKNLPDFYATLLTLIDQELTEHAFKPSLEESSLIEQVDKDPSNLELRYKLATL